MILEKLSEIAVLGTSKKTVKQEIFDWGKQYNISPSETEQYLLQAAYLDAQMREAGKKIEKNESLKPIEKVGDETNSINDNYIYQLKQILDDFQYLALPYTEKLIEARKTLPTSLIPLFLDFASRKDVEFKEKIKLVIGNRASFLAKFNKDWHFLSTKDIDWETCSHKERIIYAKKLRKQAPAKVTELIQSSFNEEHSKEKLELLECLNIKLGDYDKTFLQACQDDKSQQVRQLAFENLLKLDTQYQELLKKEAEAYFKIHKGGFLTLNRLEINLPDKDDGIFEKLGSCNNAGANLGKKATVLHKLISRLSIEFYSISFAELNKIAEKNEWKTMLLSAWQNAAIMYNNSQWAIELIPMLLKYNILIDKQLIKTINTDEFNVILNQLLSENPKKFRSKEVLGNIIKVSKQNINRKNAEIGIRQISDFLKDISIKGDYLHHEEKKILHNFFARIPWEINEIPENLEDYKELINIKQKLLKSIQ